MKQRIILAVVFGAGFMAYYLAVAFGYRHVSPTEITIWYVLLLVAVIAGLVDRLKRI